jgi:hypothetical protein
MPSNTVNFNLPYPNGTDPPCDFAEQWCDFTEAIDGVFANFQAAIDRTIPVVPLAIIHKTASSTVFNFAAIAFDTVTADTAFMTDIDADPFHITVRRPGRYTVGVGISKPTTAFSLPRFTSIFATTKFNAQSQLLDRGAGLEYFLDGYFTVETYAAGDQIGLSFSVGSQALWTIDEAWLAVMWHSDTEVP